VSFTLVIDAPGVPGIHENLSVRPGLGYPGASAPAGRRRLSRKGDS
jgi:hypothetical protein